MGNEDAQESKRSYPVDRGGERTRSRHAVCDAVLRAGRVHFSRGTREADAGAERSRDRSGAQTGGGGRVRFLQRARTRGARETEESAGLRKSVVALFAETRGALGAGAGEFPARICAGTGGIENPAASDERTFLAGA